jgi:zinc protease
MSEWRSRWPTLLTIVGVAFLAAGVFLYFRPHGVRTDMATPPVSTGPAVDLAPALPFDSEITTATLPNGLRYFVRANRQPEHRAELRLVVNAGSVLEDDDQRGLAHFVEHMAFNGTRRFPKHQIGAFMESIGMRFGPGVNATTSYDETIYHLQIPTDQSGALERALTIMEDWAHQVSFDAAEIESERGVVLEEWRMRRGVGARLQDVQFPLFVRGSRYADRLPIGTPESIQSFKPERLKQFYADWYRPDLMSVIAVGDFDPAAVAALVKSRFSSIPARPTPRPRPVFDVPPQSDTTFAIASDREATATSVGIAHRRKAVEAVTVGDYRRDTIDRLVSSILSLRLADVAQAPNSPLLQAVAASAPVTRTLEITSMNAAAPSGGVDSALRALAVEASRLAKFGVTPEELNQQKTTTLRRLERAIADRARQQSTALAAEYVRHVTTGEPVPGLQWEFDTTKMLLPGISLEDVNLAATKWLPEDNRVVSVTMPIKSGVAAPAEPALRQVLASAAKIELKPWVARSAPASLLDREPTPGTVATTVTRAPIGVTEWTLSNGVRVVLLPTKFSEDQIVFSAVSPGGLSLASDADLIPAQTATQVVNSMGFGRFGSGDLRRWLTGRAVNVQPVIGPFEQGISGGGSRQDLETMFQLIYLMMTSPRKDPTIFDALRSQMRDALANQAASPDVEFAQALSATLSQNHPRARPVTAASMDRMDLDKSVAFFKDRFADAGSFTFVMAGSFDLAEMRPLVERYLASLPSTGRHETWKDVGIRPPTGVVTRVVERGVEPKTRTVLLFTGPIEPDRRHAVAIVALADVLETRLREALREELGATYNVSVGGNASRVPVGQFTVSIDYTAAPARADALNERVFAEIAALKKSGPTPQQVNDVRAALLRDFETNSHQNPYLVGQLAQRYQSGEPPESVWQIGEIYKSLTPAVIKDAANAYLDARNYVRVTLKPGK